MPVRALGADQSRRMHATCVVTSGQAQTSGWHLHDCHGKDMLQNSLCGHQLFQRLEFSYRMHSAALTEAPPQNRQGESRARAKGG